MELNVLCTSTSRIIVLGLRLEKGNCGARQGYGVPARARGRKKGMGNMLGHGTFTNARGLKKKTEVHGVSTSNNKG